MSGAGPPHMHGALYWVPSGNGLCESYWHRGLYPSPLPPPTPFTSSMFRIMFFRTAKAYSGERQKLSTEQQFPLILTTSVFMISTPFSTAFTFLLMLMAIKIIAKMPDPDVIRTRSLLIWSQTRYHCATESIYAPRLNCRVVQSDFCQGWGVRSNCSTWKTNENLKLQKRNKFLRKESTNIFRQKWGHHSWMNKPFGLFVRGVWKSFLNK